MKKDKQPKVYPRYYNTTVYEEPEIYGIAKYNLHYHSIVSTSNSLYYSFRIGEQILVKDLCGEDIQANTAQLIGINPSAFYLNSYQTKTTSSTRVQTNESVLTNYSRFSAYQDQQYIIAPKNNGFVAYTMLKEMLSKQSQITIDLKETNTARAVYLKKTPYYVSNIVVNSTQVNNSVKISKVTGNTPEDLENEEVLVNDTIGSGVSYDPESPVLLSDHILLIEGSGEDSISINIYYYAN